MHSYASKTRARMELDKLQELGRLREEFLALDEEWQKWRDPIVSIVSLNSLPMSPRIDRCTDQVADGRSPRSSRSIIII